MSSLFIVGLCFSYFLIYLVFSDRRSFCILGLCSFLLFGLCLVFVFIWSLFIFGFFLQCVFVVVM